jgi:formate dehydrogenase subunit gamma
MATIHRWSALVVTAAIAVHVFVAAGILPGYRGVWRSMHLGGKLPAEVARRLWPGWFERAGAREHSATSTRHATSEPYHAGHDDGRRS